ncbi:hypothetical protein PC41400_26000 [Paenibacillus chitinolyticus]|uniref:Uncharacterized protein n=1 Tax=Paenibacillus chitinolyticus TaxID=79263 RepID=A0A410X2W3_9BACL|nr:hypothetical protein [Paenibacillus chitinolyticus]MCY9593782.1 hypothetical protein [Paenibacillus chitinolyticus]MCY9599287.1 hypothetical protein [Paenibacillus chitinolyticus]QAV20953.1 hypothetical protein PC41400_26000 [Paenibacillus chitinolyticus]
MYIVTPQYVNETYRSHSNLFRIQAIRRMNGLGPVSPRGSFPEMLYTRQDRSGKAGQAEQGQTSGFLAEQRDAASGKEARQQSGMPAMLRRLGETNEWKRPQDDDRPGPAEQSEEAEESLVQANAAMQQMKLNKALQAYRPFIRKQFALESAV